MKFWINGKSATFAEVEAKYGFERLDYMARATYRHRRGAREDYSDNWGNLENSDTLKIEIPGFKN